jgi:putative oxidoreductase
MNWNRLNRWAPEALGVLRIVAGLLFLEHGTQKFLSFPAGERAGTGWEFANLGAFAGPIEIIAGLLIIIGWLTRPAAFIASGTMAVAYWYAHAAILFCFMFLYLVFAGPGAFSIDGPARTVEADADAERLSSGDAASSRAARSLNTRDP